jgi:hypothetical protein
MHSQGVNIPVGFLHVGHTIGINGICRLVSAFERTLLFEQHFPHASAGEKVHSAASTATKPIRFLVFIISPPIQLKFKFGG